MTVVNPKSISGINSITTGSGSDDLLTIHTNNGTERLRIDSTGATKIVTGIVTTLTATTGIVTTLTANTVTSLGAVSGTTGTFTGDVDIADKIIHTGDTNTAIRFPAADTITFETAGFEQVRIDNDVQMFIEGDSKQAKLQLHREDSSVAADDVVGQITFTGRDSGGAGTQRVGAAISAIASSAWDTGQSIGYAPTHLDFFTQNNTGSETTLTPRLRISSGGRILINNSTAENTMGLNAKVQTFGTDASSSSVAIRRGSNDAQAAFLVLSKSRNASVGSRTILQNGDEVGNIFFVADDGTDLISNTAAIKSQVNGAPGANDTPGNLSFWTTADGANSATQRMSIDSSGRVFTGGTSIPSGSSARTLNLISTSAVEAAIVFSRSNSLGGNTTGQDIKLQTNGDLTFDVHNVGEKVRFPSTGGITFNGDTAAANALDDYEEGTFTPTCQSGGFGNWSANVGRYTKIGRLVNVSWEESFNGSGDGSLLKIGGLPFTADDWTPGSMYAQNYNSEGTDEITAAVRANEAVISVITWGGEATGNQLGGYSAWNITYTTSS